MAIDLNLILQICFVALMIALTVAVVMFIMILMDIIQITRRVKKEIKAVTFLIDILDFIISALHLAGKRIGGSKLGKTVKKSLKIAKEDE